MKSPMSRRALLRGAGGVAIALPFLDAMTPRRAARAAVGMGKAPKRLLTFLNENGVVPTAWFPTGTEKAFKMGSILDPLVPVQNNLILLDGLDNKASGGTCHAAARCGTLTGANNNGGRARHASIDQVVANHISAGTRLKSIETSVYLKGNFIYGLFFSGPGQMVQPIDDPAMVFARLFSNGVPAPATPGGPMVDPAANAEFAALRARKKSILDRAMEEYRRVSGTVGTGDQTRLARHMDGIREIERGLDAIGPGGGSGGGGVGASCKLPAMPMGADFPAHTKLQSDLVCMALACDITRVASIQTRASLTSFTWLGVNTGQHALSHQQGSAGPDAQLNKIATWFTQQVAYIVTKLQSLPDSDGQQLFDNTLLFWANDLGKGTHSKQRYPFLLATGKFTLPDGRLLETGRYLKYPNGTAHNGLLTSIAKIMGLPINEFGDGGLSKGPLPGLG
jgi:hypothetical protein